MSLHTEIQCVRRIQFCAGHRVMGHENKCAHMHGHNYVAYFHARMKWMDGEPPGKVMEVLMKGPPDIKKTDSIGRVIDFSILKEKIGGWIDEYWDHGFIVHQDDKPALTALHTFINNPDVKGQKIYRMSMNPTAENMAQFLLDTICPGLLESTDVEIVKVVLWETENCFAEATHFATV